MQASGQPFWGHGAPANPAPNAAIYVDVDTFTMYFGWASTWHVQSSPATGNATSIQGVAVSNTAPTNGQVLTYVDADKKWEAKDLPA